VPNDGYRAQLKAAGIGLEFLTGELQGSHDPSGVVFTVLAALSGMEREYIRDRTLEGHESARTRGKAVGGDRLAERGGVAVALKREPGPHVLPAMPADQRPVIVVKEERPLQVRLRRRSRVPAVRRRLIILQEFHRHRPQGRTNHHQITYSDQTVTSACPTPKSHICNPPTPNPRSTPAASTVLHAEALRTD
jgi:hypothetical protein